MTHPHDKSLDEQDGRVRHAGREAGEEMEREKSQGERNKQEHKNDLRRVNVLMMVLHRSQTVSEQVVVAVILREGRALFREDLATKRVMLYQVILENRVQGNVRLCHF